MEILGVELELLVKHVLNVHTYYLLSFSLDRTVYSYSHNESAVGSQKHNNFQQLLSGMVLEKNLSERSLGNTPDSWYDGQHNCNKLIPLTEGKRRKIMHHN